MSRSPSGYSCMERCVCFSPPQIQPSGARRQRSLIPPHCLVAAISQRCEECAPWHPAGARAARDDRGSALKAQRINKNNSGGLGKNERERDVSAAEKGVQEFVLPRKAAFCTWDAVGAGGACFLSALPNCCFCSPPRRSAASLGR